MFNLPVELEIFISFIFSLMVVTTIIPTILKVAQQKNLFDEPNPRSAHKNKVPTLGGLAIITGIMLTLAVFSDSSSLGELQYILGAIVIITTIGLKDDILYTRPLVKLIGQIFASLLVIVLADIRITNLHGIFGVYEIPYVVSLLLTLLTILVIINGFNLIDGIDGLSSGIALVVTATLGTWFLINGEYQLALIAAALGGALVSFFYYNVFSRRSKIFMGDTGSLNLGFLIALLTIHFLELNLEHGIVLKGLSAPAMAFSILIIPLFDTLRIFLLRLLNNRSPFKADKNHIHHRMLSLGFSHFRITLILIGVNVLFILIAFPLRNIGNFTLILINLFLATLFSTIPSVVLIKRKNKEIPELIQKRKFSFSDLNLFI